MIISTHGNREMILYMHAMYSDHIKAMACFLFIAAPLCLASSSRTLPFRLNIYLVFANYYYPFVLSKCLLSKSKAPISSPTSNCLPCSLSWSLSSSLWDQLREPPPMEKDTWNLFFCAWLISLNTVLSSSARFATDSTGFRSVCGWIMFWIQTAFCLSVDDQPAPQLNSFLDYHSVLQTHQVQLFPWHPDLISFGYTSRSRIVRSSIVDLFLSFFEKYVLFYLMAVCACTLTCSIWMFTLQIC